MRRKNWFWFLYWDGIYVIRMHTNTHTYKRISSIFWLNDDLQNTTKLAEVKQMVDARENEKAMEKLHVFENKLFIAEQNREKEIQKKLENIRRHVRFLHFVFIFYTVSVFRFDSSR